MIPLPEICQAFGSSPDLGQLFDSIGHGLDAHFAGVDYR